MSLMPFVGTTVYLCNKQSPVARSMIRSVATILLLPIACVSAIDKGFTDAHCDLNLIRCGHGLRERHS